MRKLCKISKFDKGIKIYLSTLPNKDNLSNLIRFTRCEMLAVSLVFALLVRYTIN